MKPKNYYLFIVLTGIILICSISCSKKIIQEKCPCNGRSTVAIMSFNIRMNYKDDGPNNWQYRRDWIADLIHFYNPGLIGMQECYYPQYADLKENLQDYGSFGPVQGRQGAESEAIFFKKEKYELLQSGTFWLSQTPEKQSIGWDAALRRSVTWGEFRIKADSQKIFIFSTQFDHKGKTARLESAKLLLKQINRIADKTIAFAVGDFNLRDENIAYKMLTNGQERLSPLFDVYRLASNPYGPVWTIQDFGHLPIEKRHRIDYIFANKPVDVEKYINISEQRGDVLPSDHDPLMAIIKLK